MDPGTRPTTRYRGFEKTGALPMASPLDSEDDVFENLKKSADPKLQDERERAMNERVHAQYEKAQRRLAELVDQNTTLPITISSVRVLGAPHTRHGFLERLVNPLLSINQNGPFTMSEALRAISSTADKLHRLDIFNPPISIYIDRPSPTDASSTPTDIAVFLSVREKSRLLLKTGTDLGNVEGSAYANLLWRNILGGAESLSVNASLGTRTRSAYSAFFDSPILSNPDLRFEIGALASATNKSWASHEEVLKGGSAKFKFLTSGGHRHEIGYSGIWRQITGLAGNASPTVRGDAGDSVKSSISHTWINDRRDNPLLPARGYLLKAVSELAGWGPLKGDVGFLKYELESQAAVPIPVPGINGDSGISFSAGLRGGLLYPLTLAGEARPKASRINDRFQLGGPTDVRGFRLSGLGPHDGSDAVGGDVYAAGSANLYFPLPRVGPEKPLRLQAFVNGGRLLALKNLPKEGSLDSETVKQSMKATMSEIANGLPSLAAGLGLVYAHPVARFELNFSLPLVLRRGEEGRKGLQFGVGINFL